MLSATCCAGWLRHAAGRMADDVVAIGLVGRGIQSSRTPGMHEREGARLGLDYSYPLLDFDPLGLPDACARRCAGRCPARPGFAGLNVTHPFKQAVIAISTTVARGGSDRRRQHGRASRRQRTGHNTDSWGFAESFREGMAGAEAGRVVAVRRRRRRGCGGLCAARARGRRSGIVDMDAARAEQLGRILSGAMAGPWSHASDARQEIAGADGIVNTTPIGMAKYPGMPFPPSFSRRGLWVADIIYFPAETALLRLARALGCRTLAGTGMAINQAVRAFELFTGTGRRSSAMAATSRRRHDDALDGSHRTCDTAVRSRSSTTTTTAAVHARPSEGSGDHCL